MARSPAKALYRWDHRIATFFPDLPIVHRLWLTLASFGIVLARCALLNRVVLQLSVALSGPFTTLRQRLRQLYRPHQDAAGNDCSFDATVCFAPLLRWVTAGFTDRRLALAIDPTNLGSRFTLRTVSVVFGGCAVPVAWQVQRGDEKGRWNAHWKHVLGLRHATLGKGWPVVVLSDRGLAAKELCAALTELGGHPLMRVKQGGHFRPDGWTKGWRGRGVVWPGSRRLRCPLLACWEAGHEGAWLIVTDLEPRSVAVGGVA